MNVLESFIKKYSISGFCTCCYRAHTMCIWYLQIWVSKCINNLKYTAPPTTDLNTTTNSISLNMAINGYEGDATELLETYGLSVVNICLQGNMINGLPKTF